MATTAFDDLLKLAQGNPKTAAFESEDEAEEDDKCEVRMNGVCYDDLDEAVHALNTGRQARKPTSPKSRSPRHNWTRKKVVVSLRGRSRHSGNFFFRPDRDLKSLLITTHGLGTHTCDDDGQCPAWLTADGCEGKAVIDCAHSGKPGLSFENVINSTTIRGLDIRRCQPGLVFTKAWAGNSILVERCNFLGNKGDPVHNVLSILIDSDKDFDHPSNGLPLRYTDEEIRAVWLSEDKGLSSFPTRLAAEDHGLVNRIQFVVRKSYFHVDVVDHVPELPDANINFDNGIDFYLNKIYKKVGVKTDDLYKKRTAHMLSLRRVNGHGVDSMWDLAPPLRPNEVNHNSPAFRRILSRMGIY